MQINTELKEGDYFLNIAGPLGNPATMKKYGKILAIGLYTGIVEVFPIAKAWQDIGNEVHTLQVTFGPMIILKDELKKVVSEHTTIGVPVDPEKSFPENMKNVTAKAREKVRDMIMDIKPDLVFMVGPVGDQKAIFEVVKEFNVPMLVDLHPIMVDGTGMCGACRVTVGGEIKFACVGGPTFNAYEVDFDELIKRSSYYRDFEMRAIQEYMQKLQGGAQ